MSEDAYSKLVQTFFSFDQVAIRQIFEELLSAAAAESSQTPGRVMSQNYETAQANPEIHLYPGNLKDARDAIFPFFWGTDSWNSPLHLENVRGPANNASLVGAIACLLKNPNLCTDRYSQRSNELEVKAITALANLIFYHTQDPWGVFTIGGTISNLYGGKIGIERVVPGAMHNGLGGRPLVGITSKASHYSNQTVAGWLGIGTRQLIAIDTDQNLSMRLDLLRGELERVYRDGILVAYVVATFGTTDGFGIDDVQAIAAILQEMSDRFGVPRAQLHVDAAVGWALTFLTDYDLGENPLGLDADMQAIVTGAKRHSHGLRYADSVTIDFHKMGRGHYPSSAFIVNRREDLKYLSRQVHDTPYFSDADPRRDPALFTLECSRPAIGPYSVMASLNAIGLIGWRMLVIRSLQLAHRLKRRLEQLDYCQVLNAGTCGASVNWWVLPKGRNAKEIFQRMVDGQLTQEQIDRYFSEVRRMFERRTKTLDPTVDARLGFTTNYGFNPHGLEIPAWKAVIFNPATDERIVDRIVDSIEEMA